MSMGKRCQMAQDCRRDAAGSKSHLYNPPKSTLVNGLWLWLRLGANAILHRKSEQLEKSAK